MAEKLTHSALAKKYRETFGPLDGKNYEIERVLLESHLALDGHVRELVDITICSKIEGLQNFIWYMPLPFESSKLTGVRLHTDNANYFFKVEHGKNKEHIEKIAFEFPSLAISEKVRLKFEYIVTNSCNLDKISVFFQEVSFPFAYKPISKTKSFEMRIYIPSSASFLITSNLIAHDSLIYEDKKVIIAYEEEFANGDISGVVKFKHTRPSFFTFISIIISLFFTCLVALVQYGEKLVGSYYPLVLGGLIFIGTLSTFRFFKNIETASSAWSE